MAEYAQGSLLSFTIDIMRKWKLIAAFVLCGLVFSIIYLERANYRYSIDYRVNPTEMDTSSLTKKFGGLAAMAGISIGGDKASSPFDLYISAIYSPEVAKILAKDPEIMKGAFEKEWDPGANAFEPPSGAMPSVVAQVKSVLGIPVYPWESPDAARLQEYIEKNVLIVKDQKKSLTTLSMEDKNPAYASHLLTSIHRAADNVIRERALNRSTQYINYISEKLREVSLAEHREALAETLGEQERVRMMSSSNLPYAAEPLGAPIVSLRPTSPKPGLILALGVIMGGALGVLTAAVLLIRKNMKG